MIGGIKSLLIEEIYRPKSKTKKLVVNFGHSISIDTDLPSLEANRHVWAAAPSRLNEMVT